MLSFDTDVMYNQNVSKIYQTIAKQLGSWASRGLSLLGKILIYKTFGLSQILFVASTLLLKKSDEAKITLWALVLCQIRQQFHIGSIILAVHH